MPMTRPTRTCSGSTSPTLTGAPGGSLQPERWRVTVLSQPCFHMGPTPMSIAKRPGYRNPARLAAAGAVAVGVAGAAVALRSITRRR